MEWKGRILIEKAYFRNNRFVEVNVEVTNCCNFDCWFCPRGAMTRPLGFMAPERFKEMVSVLHSADLLEEIALAGIGEPTLHQDLIEMIAFVKANTPFKVVLTTNGSKFSDRSFVKSLLGTNVDKVTISLRISDENKANLSPQISYDDYIQSLLDFIDIRFGNCYNTEIELSLFKETYYSQYILDIASGDFINSKRLNSFFKELSKIVKVKLPSYDDFTRGIRSRLGNVVRIPICEGLSLRFDSLSGWTRASEKYRKSEASYRSHYGSCLGLLTHFAIYWNGDVSTCCADFNVENRLGNIFEEKDVIKILSSEKALSMARSLRKKRMPTPACQICRGGSSLKEKWANILGTVFYVR